MDGNRRSFLGCIGMAGAVAVGAAASSSRAEAAAGRKEAPEDALGMLYDTTRCIGCKACVVACREANDLPVDTGPDGLHDQPTDLNWKTKNIIQLYDDGTYRSYVKRQCMHCVDPACVGACMIGALQKREFGTVTWDRDRCIGCRYCQIACPYNIPKFEWESASPNIVKCELCKQRSGDKQFQPACCEVCPREAVIAGNRDELLEIARRRIAESPGKYYQDRVYGEEDLGGTQVLYLSHVPFAKLGLPELGEEPVPELARTVQHGVYKGFVAPVALYVVAGAVMLRNRRKAKQEGDHE